MGLDLASSITTTTLPAAFDRVGRTPLIRLQRVTQGLPSSVEIFAKAEWHNPSGSVKDRAASAIVRQSLREGRIGPRRPLLDSTSGNMGIAYATLCAPLGIPVHLAIPANASRERLAMLRTLGAELILTDPVEGSDGAREVAAAMHARQPDRYFYADQYSHPANWQAHYETTGPEVIQQTEGRITHFVAGLGTTGTIVGVGRYLHQEAPHVRVVAVQPATPLHGLEGLKHLPSTPRPPIYDPSAHDELHPVETEAAYTMARRLAREEGLLVGVSSAAALAAALVIARTVSEAVFVVLFPDSGLKYLSDPMWGGP
ncbi:MAG TPA: cysteine synthase family protein [Anaerolineales bacterium]|nr:cysteine synthase family protein [Anaerolineales bacterium]